MKNLRAYLKILLSQLPQDKITQDDCKAELFDKIRRRKTLKKDKRK